VGSRGIGTRLGVAPIATARLLHDVGELVREQRLAGARRRRIAACARMPRAEAAALPSACTRTWLKSWPKRDSIKERVLASSA
jgi:hypothetical protein